MRADANPDADRVDPPVPGAADANPTPRDIGTYEGEWRSLPDGTIWTDATGQGWRRYKNSRLKIGGSHANAGAKPQALRVAARGDLSKVLHRAREIALSRKSKPRDILKAIEVLHRVGGMHSVTLLNADGDTATLPPIQIVENVIPVPGTSLLPGTDTSGEDGDEAERLFDRELRS